MAGLVAVLCVGHVLAADDAKPKKKQQARKQANPGVLAQVAKLDLTSEQKEQVETLKKEYAPKLMEANKKVGLTKETRQARAAAMKEGKEKGLKGKELQAHVQEKAPLSDEQLAAQKEVRALNDEVREKLASILNDEQKEKLGLNKKKGQAKKQKKKSA